MTTYTGKIMGDLTLNKGDDASKVTSIGGSLYVGNDAQADLPALTSIGGSLYVGNDAQADLPALTSIGGYLYVRPNAQADLPALTSIGGYLDVGNDAQADLPALTSIGGYLYVRPNAQADLPALTSIGGYPVPDIGIARQRLVTVAKRVLADPAKLDMDSWHNESSGCGTTHCIAGWAVHLEPGGYELERKVGSTLLAANILLGVEPSKLFFLDRDNALHELRKVIEADPAA